MSKFYRPNRPFLKLQVSEKGQTSEDSSSTESDEQDHNTPASNVIVRRRMPTSSHLLFVALLEHLCTVYESDPAKSKQLFQAICRILNKMDLMNPLTAIDELSTIKSQYKKSFFRLMRGALAEINQGDPGLTLRDRAAILFQPRVSSGSGQPSLSISDVLGFHTSRYRDEFVELGALGRGAYGSVFQVKNKLDGCTYAVKKIVFQSTEADIWYKVLREVKYLSSLSHTNIVRYYTAWLEQEPVAVTNAVLPNTPVLEGSSFGEEYSFSHGLPAITYNERERNNTDTNEKGDERSASIVFEHVSHASHITVLESGENLPIRPTSLPVTPQLNRFRVVMYIQMELCVSTLTEWINHRNAALSEKNGHTISIDERVCRRIMQQVLKAVDYIHSQNLIHRDLKPKNIFLSYTHENQLLAKIGDFGLSRHLSTPPQYPDFSGFTVSSPPMTPHPGAPKTPPVDGYGDVDWDMLTSGVGTTIYAAPEQLAGSQYNQKSDIYSLGLIMYELHQVFGTAMERVHCLSQARKGTLPDSFKEQWPIHSQYIEKMLSKEPENRPTVKEILNGELFKSKEEIIKDLTTSLVQEKDKVSQLSDLVDAQRTEIAKLRRELADVKNKCIPHADLEHVV